MMRAAQWLLKVCLFSMHNVGLRCKTLLIYCSLSNLINNYEHNSWNRRHNSGKNRSTQREPKKQTSTPPQMDPYLGIGTIPQYLLPIPSDEGIHNDCQTTEELDALLQGMLTVVPHEEQGLCLCFATKKEDTDKAILSIYIKICDKKDRSYPNV